MRTNSLLTYLLYALLIALIAVLGYKACQMKKDKADKIREEAELQKTLRDMGYASDSTTAGSSYAGATSDSSAYYTSPAPDANGIVDAPTTSSKSTTAKPSSTTKTPASQPATQPVTPATQATEKRITNTSTLTAKSGVSKVKGPGQGRYTVRAGTFDSKENARTRLEEVIKMGYQTAEVSASRSGKWAVVILRTNDRSKATRLAEQLQAKGVDAAVF